MTTIRFLQAGDEEEWLRMRLLLWPDGEEEHRSEMDEWRLRPDAAVVVAVRPEGGLCGFAEAGTRRWAEGCRTSPVAYLEGWYVDPDRRREGVGGALVREVERWALARGHRELASDALLENVVSQAAHLSLGFTEVERAVLYRKELPPGPKAEEGGEKREEPEATGAETRDSPTGPQPLPEPRGSLFDDGELYDLLCAGLDYGIDFYTRLAREAGGPVLELCCGTGRVMLPCLLAGAEVEGVDLYEGMLSTLRRKAEALGRKPRLHRADMSEFRLPRRFALITIPFNAFVHNLTQEAQLGCLERCREHLEPGGLLAFDTFFPGRQIICAEDGVRVLEGEVDDPATGARCRVYDIRAFDRVAQVQHSRYEVERVMPGGEVRIVHRSDLRARWIYPGEMALLLRAAGFARWEICGGFDRRPLTREDDPMIVLAWCGDDAAGAQARGAAGAG